MWLKVVRLIDTLRSLFFSLVRNGQMPFRIFRLLEVLSLIAIIAGVGVAWYEYRTQVDRTRKDRSLEYVKQFAERTHNFSKSDNSKALAGLRPQAAQWIWC